MIGAVCGDILGSTYEFGIIDHTKKNRVSMGNCAEK